MEGSPVINRPETNTNAASAREILRAKIKQHPLWNYVTASNQAWYDQEINRTIEDFDTLEEKLVFYLETAQKKHRILARVPNHKKAEVAQRLEQILNAPSGGRRNQKTEQLDDAIRALDLFEANQKLVETQVQQIQHLPSGLKDRIWQRFYSKFEQDTTGDILNPDLMENFRQSVQTTFTYLAKVLAMQAEMKAKMADEKYFSTLDENTNQTLGSVMATELEAQLEQWLSGNLSLRKWHERFEELTQKRTPQNLKEFNEHYNQVFNSAFWQAQKRMQPMYFPNFTQAFNFSSEDDFLHKFTLSDIKKLPAALKKSVLADAIEILSEFFSAAEASTEIKRLNNLKAKNPSELMKALLDLRARREQKEARAKKSLHVISQLLSHRDPQAAQVRADNLEQDFGSGIWRSLRATSLKNTIAVQCAEISRLEKKLSQTRDSAQRKIIILQLKKITDQSFSISETAETRAEKAAMLKQQFEAALRQKNFTQAHGIVNQLYQIDAIAGYKALKRVEAAEDGFSDTEKNTTHEAEPTLNVSAERQAKLKFFERCIEHAEKVMEACDQIGIPKDDPNFWGPEGIKNRFSWLKKNGLYSRYEAYNRSDPNIPSQAQNGGFRFRWMDGRGINNLTGAKAEDGIKYMDRYKESGYSLCALAGAFSINWKGSSSPTYTPEKFISLIRLEMSKV